MTKRWTTAMVTATTLVIGLVVAGCGPAATAMAAVTLTGGFDLSPDDYGRPVPLYASMLGVSADTFRQAFSGVNPNPEHVPTADEQEANKAALLAVLAPYGVTDQKMNEVADYYRFDSTKGETWPRREAKAHAVITNGAVTSIVIDDAGVGYAYPPTVAVDGHPEVSATATLGFTTDVATNGHIDAFAITG